ncbi:MAG: UDP-N-acetylmuramoyl-L-alanine--D-glutamate ligase, partial [Acidobacteriota bacterium]
MIAVTPSPATWTDTDTGAPWHRVLVYGLGLSGRAAAELLRHRGVEVVVVDARSRLTLGLDHLADDPGVRLLLGSEPDRLPDDLPWDGLDAVVVSPGVPLDRPLLVAARAAGVPVVAEVELAFPLLDGEMIAITGSNGKSTTTMLTAAMLDAAGRRAKPCGNIGEPLAAQVTPDDSTSAEPPIYVVEVSSFQLESVDRFHPKAAAFLNLSPDHLDRHHSLDAYRDAKMRVFRRQVATDVAVVNADDPAVEAATRGLPMRRRLFSRLGPVADGCWLDGSTVIEVDPAQGPPRPLFQAGDLPLTGVHNLENAMAAALLARAFDVDADAITAGLRSFCGLPHRLYKVRELDGVVWFDDSKGTNPAATAKSLAGFEDGKVLVILGGVFKGGDLDELGRLVARKARRAYLIGEAAEHFEHELRSTPGTTAAIERTETLDRAVARAAAEARP